MTDRIAPTTANYADSTMIFVAERNDSPRPAGFSQSLLGDGLRLRYRLGADEYAYEDPRIILLLDSVIDHTRRDEVSALGQKLSKELASGEFAGSLTLETYFAVLVDKARRRIHLLRDRSGVKTGYHCMRDGRLCVGTVVHEVAREGGVREFDDAAIYQLLYLNYLIDGFTYYRDVREMLIGETITFDDRPALASRSQFRMPFAERDNELSFDENVRSLHDHIVAAHRKQAGSDNIVLLSGGLDSSVMLIALLEAAPGRVRTISFRVLGTPEDETAYARSLAEHLGVVCEYVDVDPKDESVYDDFENQILSMNNPYPGRWVFGNLGQPSLRQTHFAGQDSRLHTPDLNPVDKFAFRMAQVWRRNSGRAVMRTVHRALALIHSGGWARSSKRYLRGLGRAADAFDLENYIIKYFFHCYPDVVPSEAHSQEHFDDIKEFFRVNFTSVGNQRGLYNKIVRLKWQEQYTHDMRYIQDVARVRGTYIAMPFYDPDLAAYSSSIPFKQATRLAMGRGRYSQDRVLINKYMLRLAFRERLNDKVFYRQKAVSSSLYLLCNGVLGRIMTGILNRDLSGRDSFIRQYNLEGMVERFQSHNRWTAADDKYLLKIYIFVTLCLYKQHVLVGEPERKAV